jgi:hypothetical protein
MELGRICGFEGFSGSDTFGLATCVDAQGVLRRVGGMEPVVLSFWVWKAVSLSRGFVIVVVRAAEDGMLATTFPKLSRGDSDQVNISILRFAVASSEGLQNNVLSESSRQMSFWRPPRAKL